MHFYPVRLGDGLAVPGGTTIPTASELLGGGSFAVVRQVGLAHRPSFSEHDKISALNCR